MKDDQILDMIFNYPGEFVFHDIKEQPFIEPDLLLELKELELRAIQLAEAGELQKGFDLIELAILKCPIYGSAYNNKAQIQRLLSRFDDSLLSLELAIKYGDNKVLSKAYTQKGVLLQKLGRLEESEQAFQYGARYGSELAKQKVNQNPYAKMCNSILETVMQKEMHNIQ